MTYLGLFLYFLISKYLSIRSSSFVSIKSSAGICIDDASSTSCCEVPAQVTGTFLADTTGTWDSEPNFSYILNNYAVNLVGIQYTNLQWKQIMQSIVQQISIIGTLSASRDFAWF